jgi:hypothetical protein
VGVAQSASPASRHHDCLAHPQQIGGHPAFGTHLRAGRHGDGQVFARFAVLSSTFAGPTAFGSEVSASGELEQRRNPGASDQIDASAPTTVPAVRSSQWDELFTSEGHDTIAAVPSFYPDCRLVNVNTHQFVTI